MDVLPSEYTGQARGVVSADDAITRAHRHILRCRLVVVAHHLDEVVVLAGGWLFDRTMTGWDISALITHPSDPVPLRMLGAEVIDLATMPPSAHLPTPQALAVVGDERTLDEPVHRWIVECLLDTGHPELSLWGDVHHPVLLARTEPAQHQPSRAALAFRAHALATGHSGPAAGAPQSRIESFRVAGRSRPTTAEHPRTLPH
ncbi:hypothetical protein ACIHDR_41780 [Nocardia sp. NPDC052278]|uniref:hypothetical protein n=1 Tax=unclassified Nocardia TaxID=2637762 RepID=UPI0036AE243B